MTGPIFVLIHGSWHGGWRGMRGATAETLRRHGWDVRKLAAGHDTALTRPADLAILPLAIRRRSVPCKQ
jgi:hypothetical protein